MLTKRAVLVVLALILMAPVAALADDIGLGFSGGTVNIGWWTISNATADGGSPSNWTSVGALPSPPGITYTGALGSMTFTTGDWLACNNAACDSSTFSAGGSIVFVTSAGFNAATGISEADIPVGTEVFVGSFSSDATFSYVATDWASGGYIWSLAGTVTGTLDPALAALFGLSGGSDLPGTASMNLAITFNSGSGAIGDNSVLVVDPRPVPEPGTLALFGMGLLALAGTIRRRRNT